jgi:hypothetical protein
LSQGPGDIPLLDYAINLGVALVGAAVRFVKEWRANYQDWTAGQVWFEGLANALTAGFSGVLTFWVLRSWGVDPLYTAFAVGIMGHAGPEGLALIKEVVFNAIKARAQTPPK